MRVPGKPGRTKNRLRLGAGSRWVRLAACGILLFCLSATPAAALAPDVPDSDAPPGAPPSWLPDEDWVMEHWLPYSQPRLHRALGVTEAQFEKWLYTAHDPLSDLASRQGVRQASLVRTLTAPWRSRVSARQLRELRERTRRTITQAHLLHHMLGHPFHQPSWQQRTEELFGLPSREVVALHANGMSYAEVARRGGRTYDQLHDGIASLLRKAKQRGVRTRQTPGVQGRRWLRSQIEQLPEWLTRGSGAAPAPAGHQHKAAPSPSGLATAIEVVVALRRWLSGRWVQANVSQ